ncbi:MAG TPA: hypothetical protein VMS17_29415 [Gemmataceae bacterium]|nr:hypothetical protein [Gemmataceae bacterium]
MSKVPEAVRTASRAAFIASFAALIACPLLASLFGFGPAAQLNEKRRLAPPPQFGLKGRLLAAFPAAFDAYFNDHFAFRDQLVYAYQRTLVQGLGVSPQPDLVAIGRDGWLYYVPLAMDEYRAERPFTQAELADLAAKFEEQRTWLAARGIRYVVVVAPDSQTINPEHLPAWVGRPAGPSRLDQLMAYLPAHTSVTVVDPREALRQAKQRERVYSKTDTHWNMRGSFVACQGVVDALRGWFPAVQPLNRSDYIEATPDSAGGDLAIMLGFPELYHEELVLLKPIRSFHWRAGPEFTAPAPMPFSLDWFHMIGAADFTAESDGADLPKAVIFHDSFGYLMRPFLSESFRRVVFHAARDLPQNRELVEREKPDVVIDELVERSLAPATPTAPH